MRDPNVIPRCAASQITIIIKKVEALHDGGENRCLTVDLSSRAIIGSQDIECAMLSASDAQDRLALLIDRFSGSLPAAVRSACPASDHHV